MKKLLAITVLGMLFCNTSFALSEKELRKLAAKANTEVAVNYIWGYCDSEDAFLEIMYSKHCKCAIKMGKAKNRSAAFDVWLDCTGE